MAGLDATETRNKLSQPKFEFKGLVGMNETPPRSAPPLSPSSRLSLSLSPLITEVCAGTALSLAMDRRAACRGRWQLSLLLSKSVIVVEVAKRLLIVS